MGRTTGPEDHGRKERITMSSFFDPHQRATVAAAMDGSGHSVAT
jgi:hypothetical protein